MKYLKMLGLTMAPMALMVMANTASATTLEVGGVTKNSAVELKASLEPGTSMILQKTDGTFLNTCTDSSIVAKTSTFTGSTVSGPLSSLTFTNCTHHPVGVDSAGSLSIERIGTTTDGTVRSSNAKITVPNAIFAPLTCVTGTGTDIGILTGAASGQATLDVHAVLDCGFPAPSATWEASYVITSPAGLGVIG